MIYWVHGVDEVDDLDKRIGEDKDKRRQRQATTKIITRTTRFNSLCDIRCRLDSSLVIPILHFQGLVNQIPVKMVVFASSVVVRLSVAAEEALREDTARSVSTPLV